MLKQYKLRFYNFRLVIFLLAISVIGIVLVGSAREDLKSKQLVGVILGLIIMVILSLMESVSVFAKYAFTCSSRR